MWVVQLIESSRFVSTANLYESASHLEHWNLSKHEDSFLIVDPIIVYITVLYSTVTLLYIILIR